MSAADGALVSVLNDQPTGIETAAAAVASREKAAVEARYIVALKRPRDMNEVRVRLLKECARPGFADAAWYQKPVGGQKIEGLSVRFAEAAIRLMSNISVGVLVVFDDPMRRVLRVSVTDLESNVPYEQDVTVEKTVERKKPDSNREVMAQRKNSYGDTVYIVAATEDEFVNKQNAQISKVLRNHGLRLVPGDILDECEEAIRKVRAAKVKADPDAEKKRLVDAFAAINVMPAQLAAYLEHPVEQVVEAEMIDLRAIYQAIRDGETTWQAVVEAKHGEATTANGGEPAGRPRPQRRTDAPKEAAPATDEKKEPPADAARVVELEGGSKIVHPAKDGPRPGAELHAAIYKAMPPYNRAIGENAAAKLLAEKYGTQSLASLTQEQAEEFLATLQDGAR